jgi:hypothetical protein
VVPAKCVLLAGEGKICNYLFDKKKGKLLFTGFFSSAKKSCFISSAPGGGGGTSDKTALFSTRTKKQWKKVVSFYRMKFCFFKRLASALEETMSVARPLTSGGSSLF